MHETMALVGAVAPSERIRTGIWTHLGVAILLRAFERLIEYLVHNL